MAIVVHSKRASCFNVVRSQTHISNWWDGGGESDRGRLETVAKRMPAFSGGSAGIFVLVETALRLFRPDVGNAISLNYAKLRLLLITPMTCSQSVKKLSRNNLDDLLS
jgi:hypothetical protein